MLETWQINVVIFYEIKQIILTIINKDTHFKDLKIVSKGK